MLDKLFKPKFFKKCKQYIKATEARLDVIKKKRNTVQKYLKSDIADLLRSGLDINAYGRAERLLVEQIRSSCYESIGNFCEIISNNLDLMLKQRECPEECREAVSSLIYAAARFADLPELRNLRSLFTEKYGFSLECYINKEFAEKLRPKHPTKEMKVQLMHDTAKESSIEWDSKALEQSLYTPPPMQDQPKYESVREQHNSNQTEDDAARGNKKEYNAATKASDVDSYMLQSSSSEDETTTDVSQAAPQRSCSSVGSVSEDEADSKKPFYYKSVPPPYLLRPKTGAKGNTGLDEPGPTEIKVVEDTNKPKPRSVRRRDLKAPLGRSEVNESDEEERIMDGLLLHYSKKRSPYESGKPKASPKSPSSSSSSSSIEEKEGWGRASSMPPETTAESEARQHGDHVRAKSLQPGMLHVHPKLPEYDDLVAQIASLRGTKH